MDSVGRKKGQLLFWGHRFQEASFLSVHNGGGGDKSCRGCVESAPSSALLVQVASGEGQGHTAARDTQPLGGVVMGLPCNSVISIENCSVLFCRLQLKD